jgi:hypothetical protein
LPDISSPASFGWFSICPNQATIWILPEERDWPTGARWFEAQRKEQNNAMINIWQLFFAIGFLILAICWIFEFKLQSGK